MSYCAARRREAISIRRFFLIAMLFSNTCTLVYLESVIVVPIGLDLEVAPTSLVDGVGKVCRGDVLVILKGFHQMVFNHLKPLVLVPCHRKKYRICGRRVGYGRANHHKNENPSRYHYGSSMILKNIIIITYQYLF